MSGQLLRRQQNAARKPLWGIADGDPLSVNRSGDDEVDAPRDVGGLVGVSEVLHPDERGLAFSTRYPYLPFLIPAEDVNRSATHNDDDIVRATSRQKRTIVWKVTVRKPVAIGICRPASCGRGS